MTTQQNESEQENKDRKAFEELYLTLNLIYHLRPLDIHIYEKSFNQGIKYARQESNAKMQEILDDLETIWVLLPEHTQRAFEEIKAKYNM